MEVLMICFVAGFIAQMIDGSLGMGYGIILSILLLTLGVPPVTVSASVHMAKFFSTSISGFSHLKLGNVDRSIALKLAIGGMVGAVLGTFVLTNTPTEIIKPLIAIYLTVMGVVILYKALHKTEHREGTRHITRLGAVGGFCDAIGGGGWGAIVTSGLLVRGKNPRLAIGSVSLAEFFVAVVVVGLLASEVGELLTQMQIIVGLVTGSMLAAPLAAYVCGRIAPRPLMFAVGSLVIVLSASSIISTFIG
jgi:uncharacterized membrane protein YfcA